MSQKIALIISGCRADLYAGMQALQVAERTDARIYVLQMTDGRTDCSGPRKKMQPEEISDLMGLIAWLGEIERISVSFNVFGSESDKELAEFLRRNDITCLIAGAHNSESLKQKKKWLRTLQDQLGSDKLWFQRSIQVLVTLPWDDVPFNKALQNLGYKKRKASSYK